MTNRATTTERIVRKRILFRLFGFFPPLLLYLQSLRAPKMARTNTTRGRGLRAGNTVCISVPYCASAGDAGVFAKSLFRQIALVNLSTPNTSRTNDISANGESGWAGAKI